MSHLLSSPGQYLAADQRQALQLALTDPLAPEYRQRIEIMLLTDDGATQAQICRHIGCSPLTARHWMLIAKTSQAHLWQAQPIGRPKTVSDEYLTRLLELAQLPPQQFGYGFSRWTGEWLSKHLQEELGIKISARHINRLLKEASSSEGKLGPSDRSSREAEISHLYPNLHAS